MTIRLIHVGHVGQRAQHLHFIQDLSSFLILLKSDATIKVNKINIFNYNKKSTQSPNGFWNYQVKQRANGEKQSRFFMNDKLLNFNINKWAEVGVGVEGKNCNCVMVTMRKKEEVENVQLSQVRAERIKANQM